MLLYKNNFLNIIKSQVTSGASRKKSKINFNLLLNKDIKCLTSRVSWRSGISSLGRRTVLSKGRKLSSSKSLLYSHKHLDKSIHFHHSYFFTSSLSGVYSLFFSSSGKVNYIKNSFNRLPFQLLKVKTVKPAFIDSYNMLINTKYARFSMVSSTLLFIKFMSKIHNLQVKPDRDIKYSRANGSYSIILKKNTKLSSSIVKLPSGVKKIFSSFSSCSILESQTSFKSFMFNSSSKELIAKGLSPRSRGVAKNPVDHPHGGRTKALRYPRTPWGKTTKYK